MGLAQICLFRWRAHSVYKSRICSVSLNTEQSTAKTDRALLEKRERERESFRSRIFLRSMELQFLGIDFGCALESLRHSQFPEKDCLLPLISKLLGYLIVAASTTVKLPQALFYIIFAFLSIYILFFFSTSLVLYIRGSLFCLSFRFPNIMDFRSGSEVTTAKIKSTIYQFCTVGKKYVQCRIWCTSQSCDG